MEKLKLLLIGILMISLSGCASYYMKYDNNSVRMYDHNYLPYRLTVPPFPRKPGGVLNNSAFCEYCGRNTFLNVIDKCSKCFK